jgi:multisubunit Na+/H+ antiporter MnhG subunit
MNAAHTGYDFFSPNRGAAMSVMGIIGLIWLGFGFITLAIAVRQKLPLILWIIAAVILGPNGLFWVAAAIAKKRRLPPCRLGSSPYGAGGAYGGGFGG